MFELPKLKFLYDALEPHLSEENIRLHYSKHTKKYFDTTNELIKGTIYTKYNTLEELIKSGKLKKDSKLYNNAHQAYNHMLYWENLVPKDETEKPSEELLEAIGDLKAFKEKFEEAATAGFGSYWCWAVLGENKVNFHVTQDADTPKEDILLCVDFWEHAFLYSPQYYGGKKAEYMKNIWHIIDWSVVNERYTRTRTRKA